jgi:hypothetical protein
MMQALGYKDLLSGGYYNRCGNNTNTPTTPATPTTPTTPQPPANGMQGSFSYKSSVEVSFSSDAMHMAYSQKTEVSFSFTSQAAEVSRPSPAESMQSPETSAQNILKFVDDKLKAMKADGASPEEMKKALDDGLKGYETGRDQAVDILKGYGMYEGPIKAGVEKTTELVKKGFEELGKTYLGTGTATPAPAPTTPVPTTPAPTTPTTGSTPTAPAPTTPTTPDDDDDDSSVPSVSRYRAKLYTEQTLDLEVQTRDGDTIRISIEALQKMRVNGAEWNGMTGFAGLQGDGTLESFKGMYSESSLFEVDGELDDAEKAALDDLIGSIMDLADSFYGGDMADAMDKASQLSLDPAELASMSLEMTQTQYMRASTRTYQDVAGYGSDGNTNTQGTQRAGGQANHGLAGLIDYVKSLREMAEKAGNMKSPKDFINELFAASFAQLDAAQHKPNGLGLERTDSLHRQLVNGALAEPAQAQPAEEPAKTQQAAA